MWGLCGKDGPELVRVGAEESGWGAGTEALRARVGGIHRIESWAGSCERTAPGFGRQKGL